MSAITVASASVEEISNGATTTTTTSTLPSTSTSISTSTSVTDEEESSDIDTSTPNETTTSTSTSTLTKNQKRRAREKAAKAAAAAAARMTDEKKTSTSQIQDVRLGLGEYAIVTGETVVDGKTRPLHTKMTLDSLMTRVIRASPSLYESQTPAQRLEYAKKANEKNQRPRGTYTLIYSSAQSAYDLINPTYDMVYHDVDSEMITDFKKTLSEGGQPLTQLATYDPTHSYHILIVIVSSDGQDIRRRELVVHVANPALASEPEPTPPSTAETKQSSSSAT